MVGDAILQAIRPLEAAEVLEIRERGQGQPGSVRAALLLAAALNQPPADWLRLEMGRRDQLLLAMRERTLGARMPAVVLCPACGERLELELDNAQLQSGLTGEPEAVLEVEESGYRARIRLPAGADVEAAAALPDLEAARSGLVRRCIVALEPETENLPAPLEEAVARALAQAEADRVVSLDFHCPVCAHAWRTAFDVLAYFWAEIEYWAERLLGEVHRLASAYGWSETAILSMSAARRQRYLQMIEGGYGG